MSWAGRGQDSGGFGKVDHDGEQGCEAACVLGVSVTSLAVDVRVRGASCRVHEVLTHPTPDLAPVGASGRRYRAFWPSLALLLGQHSVIHVQCLCQLANGSETRVNLVVLDTNQTAQGYTGTLSEFRLRQQTILPQPPEIPADLHDLYCRQLSPQFLNCGCS